MFVRCLLLFLSMHFCRCIDTIIPQYPLKDGHVLISKGGKFTLGFFSPGNSTDRYVGIWFSKVSVQTVVWVANRDKPINGSNGILFIQGDGNLVLSSQKIIVWSTNISYPAVSDDRNSTSCQLLESGNLVLVSNNGKSSIAWQSFDHLTDTFLPEMKLGLNKRTGLNRYLTSWRSSDDPSSGNYSFRVDPNGSPQFLLYKGSNPLWRTGPWVGQRWSGVPEMTKGYIFNYSFVSNSDEVSVSYSVRNDSIISIFVVDGVSGAVQRRTWQENSKRWTTFWSAPKDLCDEYGQCGDYGSCNPDSGSQFACSCFPGYRPKWQRDWYLRDGSQGCIREENISICKNGEGFLKFPSVKLPDTSKALVNTSMTLKECEAECLKNCSCTAYTSADERGGGTGCIALYGQLIDTEVYAGGGQDLYFRADSIELARYLKSKGPLANKKLKIILIVLAVLTFTVFVAFTWFWLNKKKRRAAITGAENGDSDTAKKVAISVVLSLVATVILVGLVVFILYKRRKSRNLSRGSRTETAERSREILISGQIQSSKRDYSEEAKKDNDFELPFFDSYALSIATNNFSDDNKLGQGGFGRVYKGVLLDGQEIAVKRLSKESGQGVEEFKNEVKLIAKLQHRNLVRLLGYCVEMDEKMLIYEYLKNRSLDSILFHKERSSILTWQKRFNIICGIARGLLYLHQDSRYRIIHRDLKASNVLLDADLEPKISDFGMARIFGGDETEGNTRRVVGTYGYMAPEYAMDGLFSTKSDVFSFGVLVLEIISGKKNRGFYNSNHELNLLGYAFKQWKEGKGTDLLDQSIGEVYSIREVLRCIQVGLLCVQERAEERPTMASVMLMLSSETSSLSQPKLPGFCMGWNPNETDSSSSKQDESFTVNQVTVTMLNAR